MSSDRHDCSTPVTIIFMSDNLGVLVSCAVMTIGRSSASISTQVRVVVDRAGDEMQLSLSAPQGSTANCAPPEPRRALRSRPDRMSDMPKREHWAHCKVSQQTEGQKYDHDTS